MSRFPSADLKHGKTSTRLNWNSATAAAEIAGAGTEIRRAADLDELGSVGDAIGGIIESYLVCRADRNAINTGFVADRDGLSPRIAEDDRTFVGEENRRGMEKEKEKEGRFHEWSVCCDAGKGKWKRKVEPRMDLARLAPSHPNLDCGGRTPQSKIFFGDARSCMIVERT